MKKAKKVMKNYRLRKDLVDAVAKASNRMNRTKTFILESALEKYLGTLRKNSH